MVNKKHYKHQVLVFDKFYCKKHSLKVHKRNNVTWFLQKVEQNFLSKYRHMVFKTKVLMLSVKEYLYY
jgi:hypothetical protein